MEKGNGNNGKDIRQDPNNYRKHSDRNKEVIRKSLDECGAGRSVLVDADGVLIAGNGVFEQAQAKGMPVKVVETDGNELVVVRRKDLKTTDKKRDELAILDNSTSDLSEFDRDLLDISHSAKDLGEMGVEDKFVEQVEKEDVDEDVKDDAVEEEAPKFPIIILRDKRRYDKWIAIKNRMRVKSDDDLLDIMTTFWEENNGAKND